MKELGSTLERVSKRSVWPHEEKEIEAIQIRPNMTFYPMGLWSPSMVCMALVRGGVDVVFGCKKHLAHTWALHSSKLIMSHMLAIASVIRVVDNVWLFGVIHQT